MAISIGTINLEADRPRKGALITSESQFEATDSPYIVTPPNIDDIVLSVNVFPSALVELRLYQSDGDYIAARIDYEENTPTLWIVRMQSSNEGSIAYAQLPEVASRPFEIAYTSSGNLFTAHYRWDTISVELLSFSPTSYGIYSTDFYGNIRTMRNLRNYTGEFDDASSIPFLWRARMKDEIDLNVGWRAYLRARKLHYWMKDTFFSEETWSRLGFTIDLPLSEYYMANENASNFIKAVV